MTELELHGQIETILVDLNDKYGYKEWMGLSIVDIAREISTRLSPILESESRAIRLQFDRYATALFMRGIHD